MATTQISIHWIRKGDEFVHPHTGQVCSVVSHRVDPDSTTQRRIRFHNGRGVLSQSFGPSIQVLVK